MYELVFMIIGIVICLAVLLQMFQWSASHVTLWRHNRRQFEMCRNAFRERLDQRQADNAVDSIARDGSWKGHRDFVVDQLVRETSQCTSVYFRPLDGKPIVGFRPGQHLPIEFAIPGESKPVVRAYSLSHAPAEPSYRISVKRCGSSGPDVPPGKVSNYVNDHLRVGDRVRCKTPSGKFFLDEKSTLPIVMLAGGVGITPMMSMIEHELRKDSSRLLLLIYGVRNRADHTFRNRLTELSEQNRHRMQVVSVYSDPEPGDVKGKDFQLKGWVSGEMLQKLLPHNNCQFYLCGPPPFMKSLYPALSDWGVPEDQIFFESFGPASVKRKTQSKSNGAKSNESTQAPSVVFSKSSVQMEFPSDVESLLELAEMAGVEIDSSCRAGSCGTCETRLLSGEVGYPDGEQPDCAAGNCLPCVARPIGKHKLGGLKHESESMGWNFRNNAGFPNPGYTLRPVGYPRFAGGSTVTLRPSESHDV